MGGAKTQRHVTLQHRDHLTNKKRYISHFIWCMDPKQSRVVTQDEENAPTNSRDTSVVWLHGKSKIFCHYFNKAQGPQTQQDGDQNQKTPPNMSCATTTTPSRIAIQQVVCICSTSSRSSLLKTDRFQMIMTTLKMCSIYTGSS